MAANAGMLEYSTVPLMLEKPPKLHNILIGNDAMQIRFAEQFLSQAHNTPALRHEKAEVVNDDMLLGKEEPKLYLVDRASLIDISPHVKARMASGRSTSLRRAAPG